MVNLLFGFSRRDSETEDVVVQLVRQTQQALLLRSRSHDGPRQVPLALRGHAAWTHRHCRASPHPQK